MKKDEEVMKAYEIVYATLDVDYLITLNNRYKLKRKL
jgi:hypothetical protein